VSALSQGWATLRSKFDALSQREQTLLLAMVGTLSLLGVVLVVGLTRPRSSALEEQLLGKREALTQLLAERDTFMERITARSDREAKLKKNSLRLSSFVEDQAREAGLGRPREFKDTQEPVPGRSEVTAHRTTVRIEDVSFEQFKDLLTSIADTDELVFIEKVGMNAAKKKEAGDHMDVELSLVTYKMGSADKEEKP
jgi:hypothetical protein